jgi:hypothetical protein
MIIRSPRSATIEKPIDVVKFVNGGVLAAPRRQFNLVIKPLVDPEHDKSLLEDWERNLYTIYDDIPEEARPMFIEILKELQAQRETTQRTLLIGVGIGIVIGVVGAAIKNS